MKDIICIHNETYEIWLTQSREEIDRERRVKGCVLARKLVEKKEMDRWMEIARERQRMSKREREVFVHKNILLHA